MIDFSKIKIIIKNEDYMQDYGTIRIELWPEGLVVWVGGQIRWKSWENAKMPTKHIMTRAEAVACFKEHMPWMGVNSDKVIDFYIEAGMLEIKEEDNICLAEAIQNKLKEKGIEASMTLIANVIVELIVLKEEETSIDAIMLRDVDGDLQQIKMLEIAKVLDKNGFEFKKKS